MKNCNKCILSFVKTILSFRDYEQLQKDLTIMKNDSALIRKTITDLEPLKSVDALQHIKGLQMDTQTLKGQVNILSMTQIARGQDFLALYNDTLALKLNFAKDIGKQSRSFNETMVHILHKFQTVAITSCAAASTVNTNTVLKFANVKYSKGTIDINRFKTTGIFRCELAGLYIIALTVMTNHEGRVYVRRNGSKLIGVYVAPIEYGNYHTGSGFVAHWRRCYCDC
ncbi:unnamed protein product [Mytilus coruscus]|uniref:C1q domain-containing protein n=1 Tax=Mytilus coruscus TaxID=42192 RepID=A0A6J8B875_MYTCO|nr:unnamed protein product [Mytilus coruscus]